MSLENLKLCRHRIFLSDSAVLDANVDSGINYVSEIDYESSNHDFLETEMHVLKHEQDSPIQERLHTIW